MEDIQLNNEITFLPVFPPTLKVVLEKKSIINKNYGRENWDGLVALA